jgi:hypothetical protein
MMTLASLINPDPRDVEEAMAVKKFRGLVSRLPLNKLKESVQRGTFLTGRHFRLILDYPENPE